MRSSATSLAEALSGTWRELDNRVIVTLDTERGTYASERPDRPGVKHHRLRLERRSGEGVRLYKDDMPIDARLRVDGLLSLVAAQREFHFVFSRNSQDMRVCPKCFSRTEITGKYCAVCGWRFIE